MIIYKITNILNGKMYIGQTKSKLSIRWSQHVHAAIKNKSRSVLALAIIKYGKENFKVEQIEQCTSIDILNNREKEIISQLNSISPFGYNLDSGGKNKNMHDSTKKKISDARKGKKIGPFSEEHKLAISASLKKAGICPPNTPEVNAKKALPGDKNGMFGKKHSQAAKQKMSNNRRSTVGVDNHFFGKKHSEETKQKMRMTRLSRGNK